MKKINVAFLCITLVFVLCIPVLFAGCDLFAKKTNNDTRFSLDWITVDSDEVTSAVVYTNNDSQARLISANGKGYDGYVQFCAYHRPYNNFYIGDDLHLSVAIYYKRADGSLHGAVANNLEFEITKALIDGDSNGIVDKTISCEDGDDVLTISFRFTYNN